MDAMWESVTQRQKRLTVLMAMVIAAAALLGGRFFYWHVLCANRGPDIDVHRRFKIIHRAQRGNIMDVSGHLLVIDVAHYHICCDPSKLKTPQDRLDLAEAVLPAVDKSKGAICDLLEEHAEDTYLRLELNVPASKVSLIPPGTDITLEPVPNRAYPEGPMAAHLLGLTRMDRNGINGIEESYNDVLTGTHGVERIYDGPWGRYSHDLDPPVDGANLTLTLDRAVQFETQRVLEMTVLQERADGGTIIVMDPRTGGILAMASYPTFDPNRFAEYWAVPESLLLNPAVSRHYEPGSVFKIVTMAAALDSKTVQPNSTYEDSGLIRIGGQDLRNSDLKAYGTTSMTELLIHSLNVGAAKLAKDMRATVFYDYVKALGFGQPTGIDLANEASGTLHTPGSSSWSESDLATNSFGQGIAVTPIQMISAVAAVANGGVRVGPHVVKEINQGGSAEAIAPPLGQRVISEETARALTNMLVETVDKGCPAATISGYRIAGKTGTAQIPILGGYSEKPEDIITSFVGYAPADDPAFLILVKIDRPRINHWGTTVAAPAFRVLASRLFSLMDIPPDNMRLAVR